MYKIERTNYGYRLTFSGYICADEMKKWLEESHKILSTAPIEFFVFVDMRNLKPLPRDSQDLMTSGQNFYLQKGMKRSVVIVGNPVTKIQFKRLAIKSGIYTWERYIDIETEPNWEQKGLDWILKAKDPDI
jgi:hypothetical protein